MPELCVNTGPYVPRVSNLAVSCILKKDSPKEIVLENNELFPQTFCSSPKLKKKKKNLNSSPLFWLKVSLQIIVSEFQETENALMKPLLEEKCNSSIYIVNKWVLVFCGLLTVLEPKPLYFCCKTVKLLFISMLTRQTEWENPRVQDLPFVRTFITTYKKMFLWFRKGTCI